MTTSKITIASVCLELIKQGLTNQQVAAAACAKFPNAKTSAASVAWYRSKMKDAPEVKAAKVAKAAVDKAKAKAAKTDQEVVTEIGAKLSQYFSNLAYRWSDEKEYENFQDYIDAMTKQLAKHGAVLTKMTKRPFAANFLVGQLRCRFVVKGSKVLLEQLI